MPLFDYQCKSCGVRFEAYLHRRENPDPACECGGETQRMISRFAAIWTKSLSDYGDKTKETWNADQKAGGHWVACKRSFGGTPEKPIRRFLRTTQEQREYCKAEGLYDPSELGAMEMSKDGQTFSSRSLPGCW